MQEPGVDGSPAGLDDQVSLCARSAPGYATFGAGHRDDAWLESCSGVEAAKEG